MRGRRGVAAAVPVTVLALLAVPAGAGADETITAIPRDRYEAAETTIDVGERVTFSNRDIVTHDVFGDGFKSPHTDPGANSRVEGAERLGPGRYEFICSLHAHMKATLVVRGTATPSPPPPPPPDESPPPEAPPADTTAPRIGVRVKAGVLRVRVDEAATVVIRAGARRVRRTTDGPATIRVRLPRRARRVSITASDPAGNRRTVSRRLPSRR
jgi:plastocyanin